MPLKFFQNVNVLFAAVFPEPLLADLDLLCGDLLFLYSPSRSSGPKTKYRLRGVAFAGRLEDWSYPSNSFACLVLRAVAATAISVALVAGALAGQKDARNERPYIYSPDFLFVGVR